MSPSCRGGSRTAPTPFTQTFEARRSSSRVLPGSTPGTAPAESAHPCTPSLRPDPCIPACACVGSADFLQNVRKDLTDRTPRLLTQFVQSQRSDEDPFQLVPPRPWPSVNGGRSPAGSGNFSFFAIARSSASRSWEFPGETAECARPAGPAVSGPPRADPAATSRTPR